MSHDVNEASPHAGRHREPLAPSPLGFLAPLVVFMLAGLLEPTPGKPFEFLGFKIALAFYPWVYTAKIALTIAAMAYFSRVYRLFPWRISPLSVVVGAVGVVVWVVLTNLGLERPVLDLLRRPILGGRSAYNPLEQLAAQPIAAYGFLAIRLFGLSVIVPVIEEFFLRGFAMRYLINPDAWWKVPFGTLTPLAVAVGTLLPMAMHPAELLAAGVWFSMVSWLMARTKNIWDCVIAHAVTNGLLGAWAIYSGQWHFL